MHVICMYVKGYAIFNVLLVYISSKWKMSKTRKCQRVTKTESRCNRLRHAGFCIDLIYLKTYNPSFLSLVSCQKGKGRSWETDACKAASVVHAGLDPAPWYWEDCNTWMHVLVQEWVAPHRAPSWVCMLHYTDPPLHAWSSLEPQARILQGAQQWDNHSRNHHEWFHPLWVLGLAHRTIHARLSMITLDEWDWIFWKPSPPKKQN